MRRFLYYNEDTINSLLAQIESGLILKATNENSVSQSNSVNEGKKETVMGDLAAKVIGIGTEVKGEKENDNSVGEVTTRLLKSVQEKMLHDYAFDIVFEFMSTQGLICECPEKIGDMVLVKETPTFLDFGYFRDLFADDGAVKFCNEQNTEEIRKQILQFRTALPKGSGLDDERKAQVKEFKEQIKDLENQINNLDPERKKVLKTIDAIKAIIPYNRFIMTNNYLIPLDDRNFRDVPEIVAFKYGGEMSVFGYVTNIIHKNEDANKTENDFLSYYKTMNQVILNMFKEDDEIFILHPIAMFY